LKLIETKVKQNYNEINWRIETPVTLRTKKKMLQCEVDKLAARIEDEVERKKGLVELMQILHPVLE